MSFELIALLSLCIIIPGIIALIRFSKIHESYYPFIFCIWIGAINEILNVVLAKTHHPNTVNTNIYLLIEALLLTWQFKKWDLFGKGPWFKLIMALLIAVWLFENFKMSSITSFDSYFRITYSAIITFMSISKINYLIVSERRSLLKNPIFILCTAFVLYYTLSVLSEATWVYGIGENKSFRKSIDYISVITNFISIILYSISILWMPTKHRFTMPFS